MPSGKKWKFVIIDALRNETNQKECPDYYTLFLPKVKFKANVEHKNYDQRTRF